MRVYPASFLPLIPVRERKLASDRSPEKLEMSVGKRVQ